MQLQFRDNLPFVSLKVTYSGKSIEIPHVLVDTGSASTIFSADYLEKVSIAPSADDILHTIRGVGGVEVVYLREVDFLELGRCKVSNFEVEVGGMDYGFDINGILGMDFMTKAGAIINLQDMTIDFAL